MVESSNEKAGLFQVRRIDQTLIGQLQFRNRRQAQERQRHERRFQFAAHRVRGGVEIRRFV